MKITHNKVGQNLNLVDTGKADQAMKTKGPSSSTGASALKELQAETGNISSSVDVSPRAMEAKKMKDIAMATPDVDEAKVAKFRQMIDAGTYRVDAKAVADRMVDEQLKFGEE